MRTSGLRNVVLAGVLVLSACGGDDDATTSDRSDAPADTASDAPAAEPATITIEGFAFDGATEVAVGTTVVVTNLDGTPHTWTALDGTFDSGSLGEGDTFEFTFTEPGTFDYQCNFHPSMTGTITVS